MDVGEDNLYFSSMPTRSVRGSQPRAHNSEDIPAFFLYGEPLQPPDERLIHVETIAARSLLHHWTIKPHRHRDLNQLLILHRGAVAYSLDGRSGSLKAPVLIAVPPSAVHSFTFQPGTVGLVISFAPSLMAELAAPGTGIAHFLEQPTAQALNLRSVRETDLHALGNMLLREFTRSAPGRQTALRGILAAVFANVLRLAHPSMAADAQARAPERELVARFRHLIEVGYRTHVPVASYARELSVTETKLRRACIAVAGHAPIEILHLRLLVEAERQLRYTTMSIAQVAYHLGFEDPAYFSRFFTQRMRISPRAFRAREATGELIR